MSDRFSKHRFVSQSINSRRSTPLVGDRDHFFRVQTWNFSLILPLVSDHLGDHAICWTKVSKHGFIFTISSIQYK